MATVLIIDDDVHVARLLQSHLTDEGFEVSVAHRANEGMALALKTPPDVILLDVILPDATGFQMCNQFRNTAATRSVPIIMMSGVARNSNQQVFGMERGANEYILKPFKILEMGELVHSYVGKSRKAPLAHSSLPAPVELMPIPPAPPSTTSGIHSQPNVSPDGLNELRSFLKQALLKAKPKE